MQALQRDTRTRNEIWSTADESYVDRLPINRVVHGDCLEVLKDFPDNSIDAICSDPPSSIHFMGKEWDADKGGRDQWVDWLAAIMREAMRVTKPGGHAFIWALPRTSHWTALALEDAGWTIREKCYHLFGQGFPKSLNLGNGQGTALKPAVEEWILCRKPLAEHSIAANVLTYGTGGLNIDACRVGTASDMNPRDFDDSRRTAPKFSGILNGGKEGQYRASPGTVPNGRFPSHLLLSHTIWCVPPSCEPGCPIRALDEMSGVRKSGKPGKNGHQRVATLYLHTAWQGIRSNQDAGTLYGNTGTASRYFQQFPPEMVDNNVTSLYNGEKHMEVNQWSEHGDISANEITDGIENGDCQEAASNTANLSIDGFGSKHTAQFLKDTKYTTSTTTQPITDLKTSNSLLANGTTITTNDSEKTTELTSKGLKSGIVEDASNTSLLTNSTLDEQAHITDIASLAATNRSSNGVIRTESTTYSTAKNTTAQPDNRYFTNLPPDVPYLYTAKASRAERNQGCEGLPLHHDSGCYGTETIEGAAARGRRPRHSTGLYQLRDDLTPEQREYVSSELAKIGGAF